MALTERRYIFSRPAGLHKGRRYNQIRKLSTFHFQLSISRMPLPYNGQCVSRAAKIILYFFAVFL